MKNAITPCPLCSAARTMRYPGNDPESGPRVPTCAEHGSTLDVIWCEVLCFIEEEVSDVEAEDRYKLAQAICISEGGHHFIPDDEGDAENGPPLHVEFHCARCFMQYPNSETVQC